MWITHVVDRIANLSQRLLIILRVDKAQLLADPLVNRFVFTQIIGKEGFQKMATKAEASTLKLVSFFLCHY
jgi:hypothetical protein